MRSLRGVLADTILGALNQIPSGVMGQALPAHFEAR